MRDSIATALAVTGCRAPTLPMPVLAQRTRRAAALRAGGIGERYLSRALRALLAVALLLSLSGCGTTRWSDTARTATEQLLISNAIDRAVSELDFSVLGGRDVYFDPMYLRGTTDENYLVSSLRQHLLASGVVLREARTEADFVVEARSGGVGTDRSDLLFGVPSVAVPSVPGMPVPMPSTIPEIPFAKSTNQRAVAKIAVFAYNRKTGRPVLQSGVVPVTSTARNSWFFGAGPFQRGTVYEGTNFAGDQVSVPIIGGRRQNRDANNEEPIATGTVYRDGFEVADDPQAAGASGSAPPLVASTPTAANSAAALPPVRSQPPASAAPAGASPSASPVSLPPTATPSAAPPPPAPASPPPLPAGPTGVSGATSFGTGAQSTQSNGQWLVDLWHLRETGGAN